MLKDIAAALRWFVTLGKHFFRVVPFATTTAVVLTLTSQVALIMSFFLPLKVIILLGSDGIPSYFPQALASVDRDLVIIALSVLTIAAYATHTIAKRIAEWASNYGVRQLLAQSQKMVLFENQDEFATNSYRRYAEVLAGITFFVVSVSALAYFYTSVSAVIIAFLVSCVFIAEIAWRNSLSAREKLTNSLPQIIRSTGSIAFFTVFAFVVADFLVFNPPGFIVAIITVLLCRQLFNWFGSGIIQLHTLYRQQNKLAALYFHQQAFEPLAGKEENTAWRLLHNEYRSKWISAILKNCFDRLPENTTVQWCQTSLNNIIGLIVTDQQSDKKLFIKIFGQKNPSPALHEATLLLDNPAGLPAPPVVSTTFVDRFHCHIFDITELRQASGQPNGDADYRLRKALLGVEPSPALIERYSRSQQMLWSFLSPSLFDRLKLIANDGDLLYIEKLEAEVHKVQSILKGLPKTLYAPKPPGDMLFMDQQNNIYSTHWVTWTLEPAGAGWPVNDKNIGKLHEAITETSTQRISFKGIPRHQYELAALAYALHDNYKKQKYQDALLILRRMVETMENHSIESDTAESIGSPHQSRRAIQG